MTAFPRVLCHCFLPTITAITPCSSPLPRYPFPWLLSFILRLPLSNIFSFYSSSHSSLFFFSSSFTLYFTSLMLRNTMTDDLQCLFCLIDGEATPISIKIPSSDTDDSLKDLSLMTLSQTSSLYGISYVPAGLAQANLLREILSPTELDSTDDISDVFKETPLKKTNRLFSAFLVFFFGGGIV